MIYRLEIENFYSFRDPQVLDAAAQAVAEMIAGIDRAKIPTNPTADA